MLVTILETETFSIIVTMTIVIYQGYGEPIDGGGDHELLEDMDCLDDDWIDNDIDDRGLLEVFGWT